MFDEGPLPKTPPEEKYRSRIFGIGYLVFGALLALCLGGGFLFSGFLRRQTPQSPDLKSSSDRSVSNTDADGHGKISTLATQEMAPHFGPRLQSLVATVRKRPGLTALVGGAVALLLAAAIVAAVVLVQRNRTSLLETSDALPQADKHHTIEDDSRATKRFPSGGIAAIVVVAVMMIAGGFYLRKKYTEYRVRRDFKKEDLMEPSENVPLTYYKVEDPDVDEELLEYDTAMSDMSDKSVDDLE